MNDSIKHAYDQIHAEEALKADTRAFLKKKVFKRASIFSRYAALPGSIQFTAVCAMTLFLLTGGTLSYITPVTSIHIDVNPSIEMNVNIFNRVISLKGYNDDGTKLVSDLNVRNMNSIDAVDNILSSSEMEKYLNEDSYLSVTVAGNNTSRTRQLLTGIENSDAGHMQNLHCFEADSHELSAARRSGLSMGKYRAYLELQQHDPSIRPEDVKDMTMRQIYDKIAILSGEEIHHNGQHNGTGTGNGFGNGSGNGNGHNGKGRGIHE